MSGNKWNTTPSEQGMGDVTGPASSTDNAIARYDGTGGKTLQNSGATIDDSNNLDGINEANFDGTTSIGVSPETWNAYSRLRIDARTGVFGSSTTSQFGHNIYWNSGFKYISTNPATLYQNNDSGQHLWYTAPSGTAGTAVSVSDKMMLDSSRLNIYNDVRSYGFDGTNYRGSYDRTTSQTVGASTQFDAMRVLKKDESTVIVGTYALYVTITAQKNGGEESWVYYWLWSNGGTATYTLVAQNTNGTTELNVTGGGSVADGSGQKLQFTTGGTAADTDVTVRVMGTVLEA
jgi:hypothetical protein